MGIFDLDNVFATSEACSWQDLEVQGISHLKFLENQVIYHRDYFDLGEMVYEHVPVLGKIVRFIKNSLGQ
jgi:limonene-1,2-epoxide hydrolase